MQSFTLPAVRVYELASTVLDAIPLSELATMKDIRLTSTIIKDLRAVLGEFGQKMMEFEVKKLEVAAPFRARYEAEKNGLSEPERVALVKTLDALIIDGINEKYKTDLKELDELGRAEVTVELADDKHAKLKELFEKYAPKLYQSKTVFLEVADTLGIE